MTDHHTIMCGCVISNTLKYFQESLNAWLRVDAMAEKGEVSFAEKCGQSLDICDEFGTKGDKKHAKRKAKSRLKHK